MDDPHHGMWWIGLTSELAAQRTWIHADLTFIFSHKDKSISSPLHYHLNFLLRLPSSPEVNFPEPAVMNLNTGFLWSRYHNAYFCEISSAFSATLWSPRRSEAQNYKKWKWTSQTEDRPGCNPLWMTRYNIIPLLFMFQLCYSRLLRFIKLVNKSILILL